MDQQAPQYSIVIPICNSSRSIEAVCQGIQALFKRLDQSYEVILVDDASQDESWQVLQALHAQNSNIKVIRLMRNFGQQNAVLCGFKQSRGDFVITMDDDLQHPPEEIPKLIAKVNDGYDVVIGALIEKQDRAVKKIGSRMVAWLSRVVLQKPRELKLSGFRILRRSVVEAIGCIHTPYPYLTGMIFSVTRNVANTAVVHKPRQHGQSNYNLKKLISLAFNLLIHYSALPLRLITFVGGAMAVGSFLLGIYFIIKKMLIGQVVPGWTTLVVLLSFFNGLLMVALSLIGEYLVRLLGEVSNRPQYVIRELKE